MRSLLPLLGISSLASAHFLVNTPPSIGFDESKEGSGPCGGFTPDLSNAKQVVDFHAGGDAISVKLTHNQARWLFRVTDDPTGQKGWEQIFPIVLQSGLGDMCEPQIAVPEKYVGKKGVIGVVADAPDGLLYQCISANFVEGVNSNVPSACKNASSVTVDFASDSALSALLQGGGSSSSGASNGSSTMTAPAKSSPTGNAASLKAASLWMALVGAAFAF